MATSGSDIMTLLAPKSRGNALRFQVVQEAFLDEQCRSFPIQTFNVVVGYQVHLGSETARVPGERTRLFICIINATNEDVFEGNALTLARAIVLARI